MEEQGERETAAPQENKGELARRWAMEFSAARKATEKWRKEAADIGKRFRVESTEQDVDLKRRWNLFTSSIQTQAAMLYGQTPRVAVTRRYADSSDDVARVASEMMERILNADIECDWDDYASAVGQALLDRILGGMGSLRVRYEAGEIESSTTAAILDPQTGRELAPAVTTESRPDEEVEVLHLHIDDQLWSPVRKPQEVRWWAFRAEMGRAELVERFGEELGRAIPLNARRKPEDEDLPAPWDQAVIWEIWSKPDKRVYWYCEGYPAILDSREDPLGLEGFFPIPRPMFANLTNDKLIPVPDFRVAESLYKEIDRLTIRIGLLEDAIRVAGIYPEGFGELQRLVESREENVLIPVQNWSAIMEKGGIPGAISWLPLDQLVSALGVLTQQRQGLIDALYQVTGQSDIMRGQAVEAGATATEQAAKVRFASVRMDALQREFSRFCGDALRLKAELIAAHYAPETIIQQSNVMATPDAQLAQAAVQLIKSGEASRWRIEVKPEALAQQDFAALKSESMEVLQGIGSFLQAAAPIMSTTPVAVPYLLQMLQWALARLKGASTIEAVLDRAIEQAQQAAQQPQQAQAPDPKLLATQMKVQGDLQKEQLKVRGDLARIQAETDAKAQQEQDQAHWNVTEAFQKAQIQHAMKLKEQQSNPQGFEP